MQSWKKCLRGYLIQLSLLYFLDGLSSPRNCIITAFGGLISPRNCIINASSLCNSQRINKYIELQNIPSKYPIPRICKHPLSPLQYFSKILFFHNIAFAINRMLHHINTFLCWNSMVKNLQSNVIISSENCNYVWYLINISKWFLS